MAATPQANGHVFDTREAVVEAENEYPPFPFIGLDGLQYQLPHPFLLTTGQQQGVIEAQASGDPNKIEMAMDALLRAIAPEAHQAMMNLPAAVTGKLMEAWHAQAEETVGELGNGSGAPSRPNRAARRSKPTSSSRASTSTRSASTR